MKATTIKATAFTNGKLVKLFIPRKVTQGELSSAIKNDTFTFSDKAKLVEYEICKVSVDLTLTNLQEQVADVLKLAAETDTDTLLYIM